MPLPPAGPFGFEPNNTLLTIIPLSGGTGLIVTPWSARGLSQTFKQVGSGGQNIRRTVIGTTVNLTPPWFHQYATTIRCSDVTKPTFDGTWRGQDFEVHCAGELEYEVGGTAQRPVVSGSERTEGHTVYYRPVLFCMLIDFEMTFREYEGFWDWRIDLEENGLP